MDFYPRSPCGERLDQADIRRIRAQISIHALLAESDFRLFFIIFDLFNFYPRSPCGERRKARGMTLEEFDFYPRSPCGERPGCGSFFLMYHYFYPRSPCGERLGRAVWPGLSL